MASPNTYTCRYSSCQKVLFDTREAQKSHYRHEHCLTYCSTCETHYPSACELADHIRRRHPRETPRSRHTLRSPLVPEQYRRGPVIEERLYERSGAQNARKHAQEAWDAAEKAKQRAEKLRRELHEDEELYRARRPGKEPQAKEMKGESRRTEYGDEAWDAAQKARSRAERLRRELREAEELYQQRQRKESEPKGMKGEPRRKECREDAERHGSGTAGRTAEEKPRRDAHEKPRASDSERRDSDPPTQNTRQPPKQETKQEIPPPPDHYAILGISPTATDAEVLKAAKKKRIETHPDRFAGQALAPSEAEKMIEHSKNIGHAADILSDPDARSDYDREVARWKAKQTTEDARPATKTAKKPANTYNEYRDTKTFYESESEEDVGHATDDRAHRRGETTQKPKYKPKFNSPLRPEGYQTAYRNDRPR